MNEGFDMIKVIGKTGAKLELTRDQFLALPLHERIRHLMQGRPKFFKDGSPVRKREAVRALSADVDQPVPSSGPISASTTARTTSSW